MKKLFYLVCIFVFVQFINTNIYAEVPKENTTNLDISKTLSDTDTNLNYDINFNLPTQGKKERVVIDMVFVMDTTSINSYTQVRKDINDFLDKSLANENILLNVGVITFSQNVNVKTKSLIELNQSSIDEIKSKFTQSYLSGSNMYGGILQGEKLLDGGSAVESKKYLILASDFGGYKSDNGNGIGLSYFHKTDSGVDAVTDNSDFHGKYYGIKDPQMAKNVFTVNSVDNLIRNKMYFNGNVIQSDYEKYLINTGKDASEYPDSWKNTHTWTVEELDGLATSAEATNRQLFPTSFEKNIYMSGNEFLKIKNKGYNIIGLTSPYQEEDGSSFKRKFNAASNAFKDWFELNIGTRYESTKNESMRDILDDLSAEWSYLIGKGEIVDTVNDKFIVIDGFETVSLNNSILSKHVLSKNEIGFGEKDNNGIYPYIYRIEKKNNKEIITWEINKKPKINDRLKVSFRVKLKEIPKKEGAYIYDTNNEAFIDYVSSKDIDNGVTEYNKRQYMPSPSIKIKVSKIVVDYVDVNGNKLAESTMQTGLLGTDYFTNAKNIKGYKLKEVIGKPNGKYTSENIKIKYVYEKNNKISKTGSYTSIVFIIISGIGISLFNIKRKYV